MVDAGYTDKSIRIEDAQSSMMKLNDAFLEASRDPQLQQRLVANGTPLHTSSPAEMGRLLSDEVVRTQELVRDLGIKQ